MQRFASSLFSAFVVCSAIACGSSATPLPTEVSIRIEADSALQASIRSVRVVVRNDDATERSNQSIDTSSSFFAGWPFRLSLSPRTSPSERYEVIAEASNASGAIVGRTRVVSGFLPNAKAELVLWFLGDCTAQCPTGFSCGRDARGTTGCLPDERPPTPIEDAGVFFDAGVAQDAGMDVALTDSGNCSLEICGNLIDDDCNGLIDDCVVDSGMPDTGTVDAGRCNAEICGNLIDDDCNGLIDDCAIDSGVDGSVDAGMNDASRCVAEVCGNLIDDDCNGLIDDGCAQTGEMVIYANTGTELFRYRPEINQIENVGRFRFADGSLPSSAQSMSDIAADSSKRFWGIHGTSLVSLQVSDARIARIGYLDFGTDLLEAGELFAGLSFVPTRFLTRTSAEGETLALFTSRGRVYSIDLVTAVASFVTTLDGFGVSGDAIYEPTEGKFWVTSPGDRLLNFRPTAPVLPVLNQGLVHLADGTTIERIFGLSAAAGIIYGFSDSGGIYRIERTGDAVLLLNTSSASVANRYYGAAAGILEN